MSFWRGLEIMMDNMVDNYWAEPVQIIPWGPIGIDDDGAPDPARKAVNTRGVLVMPGAAATGEAGTMATGMVSGQLDLTTWLSITDFNLKTLKLSDLQHGDRIYFPERDEWYAMDRPIPSKTGRPQIYLQRLQETTVRDQ